MRALIEGTKRLSFDEITKLMQGATSKLAVINPEVESEIKVIEE